jgi:hypothetical protein
VSVVEPLSSDDLGSIPFFGDGYQIGKNLVDGNIAQVASEVKGVVGDIGSFASAAAGGATWLDPLSVLVNAGLGFLIDHLAPLKHGMELVTGDSGTVGAAADTWSRIATDLQGLATDLDGALSSGLTGWSGQGAQAASREFAQLIVAINGMSNESTSMSDLLASSAALMEAALDIVKSIISDLISWLIMTWLAAQATAIITVGASEVAAMGATVVEVGVTTTRVTGKVTEVSRIVLRIEQVVVRIERVVTVQVQTVSRFQSFASAARAGIGAQALKAAGSAATSAAESLGAKAADGAVHRAVDTANGRGPAPGASDRAIEDGLEVGR